VFVIKAGILSGAFYVQAIALFATALVMAWIRREGLPDYGLTLYGIVSAACFFVPGWKYYVRRERESNR
jgi:serine/threonine-protein kinase